MKILLTLIALLAASCLVCCKGVNNTAYITDDVYLNITLAPAADTSKYLTLATGSYTYNIDSYLKVRTGDEYLIGSLSSLKLSSADVTFHNTTAANNAGNFFVFNLACFTDIEAQEIQATKYGVPDLFATTIDNFYLPSSTVNYYLRGAKNLNPSSVTFTYRALCKLRRPLTDSLHGTFHLQYVIGLYKK